MSANRNYNISVIPGDGIGKEVMPEGIRVLEHAASLYGFTIAQTWQDFACCDYYARHGQMMPDDWKARIGDPAANATVAKLTTLRLTFSETFLAPMSGLELTMTGMPGMAGHAPMPVKGLKTSAVGKTMTATLPRALPAGSYELKWHIVGADQHRMEGRYSFQVK